MELDLTPKGNVVATGEYSKNTKYLDIVHQTAPPTIRIRTTTFTVLGPDGFAAGEKSQGRLTDLRLERYVVVEDPLSLGHPELDVVGRAPGWPAPAASVGAGGKGRGGGGGSLSRGRGGARSGRKGL